MPDEAKTLLGDEELLRQSRQKKRSELTPDELRVRRAYEATHKRKHDKAKRIERDEKKFKAIRLKDQQNAELSAEEASINAERIRKERIQMLTNELSHLESDGSIKEEICDDGSSYLKWFLNELDLWLALYESLPFEKMWERLSIDTLGRCVLKYYGVEPMSLDPNKQYICDSSGVHEYIPYTTPKDNVEPVLIESPTSTKARLDADRELKLANDVVHAERMKVLEVQWKASRERMSS